MISRLIEWIKDAWYALMVDEWRDEDIYDGED